MTPSATRRARAVRSSMRARHFALARVERCGSFSDTGSLSRRSSVSVSFARSASASPSTAWAPSSMSKSPCPSACAGVMWRRSTCLRSVTPRRELPTLTLWSTKEKGRSGSSETSHRESLHISMAMGLMSTPYRQEATTSRSARCLRAAGLSSASPSSCQASTRRSARYRAAATRKAPDPQAMSATFNWSSSPAGSSRHRLRSDVWYGPG